MSCECFEGYSLEWAGDLYYIAILTELIKPNLEEKGVNF